VERIEKIETISSTLFKIREFIYYGETDFIKTETTTITSLNGHLQKKKTWRYYKAKGLKKTLTIDSKNEAKKARYKRNPKNWCGLKEHLKNLKSTDAKITIEYYN